jgi:hypothetical protein
MKLCRFEVATGSGVRAGLILNDEDVIDLAGAGVERMKDLLE